MKKIIIAMLSFIVVIYALPIITVGMRDAPQKYYDEKTNEEPGIEEQTEKKPGYDENNKVTVLVGDRTVEMSFKDYLTGVVAAEMPASFPMEALKAQAVAARSYMLYCIENNDKADKHPEAQLCDDYTHCTAYIDIETEGPMIWDSDYQSHKNKITAAVESTDGIVAMSEGKVIAAVFHSASGEMTESAYSVWGIEYPYLVSVANFGGSESPNFYGTVEVSLNDFTVKIKESFPNADLRGSADTWFKNTRRNKSGSITDVEIGGVKVKGTELRAMFNLNSANFTIKISDNKIIFSTVGTGHGVGMSQYGAREMALNGAYFDEIICHYYSDVRLMIKN